METKKQVPIINKVFLMFFLLFSKQTNPKPEFINNPPNKDPKEIPFITNNSLKRTLEAQFGIKPIITENNGDKYLLDCKNTLILSSPTKAIIIANVKEIIKT